MEAESFNVTGKPNEPITLPIAGGPATGFSWRLDLPAGVEQIEDGPERSAGDSARLGAATGGSLRVTATRGEHTIVARLVRPWEPDQPARVVRIQLHVE